MVLTHKDMTVTLQVAAIWSTVEPRSHRCAHGSTHSGLHAALCQQESWRWMKVQLGGVTEATQQRRALVLDSQST